MSEIFARKKDGKIGELIYEGHRDDSQRHIAD
jgi:hypothetical protein